MSVIGANNFKDWWVTVWMEDAQVTMPSVCACCLGSEGLSPKCLRVRQKGQESTVNLSYPLCHDCRAHCQFDEKAVGLAVLGGFILPVGLYVSTFGLTVLKSLVLTGMIGFIVCLLTGGALYWLLSRFAPARKPECAESGWPVEDEPAALESPIFGASTERTDERQARLLGLAVWKLLGPQGLGLRFTNKEYARCFIEANGGQWESASYVEEAL